MDLTGLLLMFGLLLLGGVLYLVTIQYSPKAARKTNLPPRNAPRELPMDVPKEPPRKSLRESPRKSLRDEDNSETAEEMFPHIEFPPEIPEDYVSELPREYNENKITIMARDPETIFAYWEVSEEKKNSLKNIYGSKWDKSQQVVRVHDITGVDYFDGTNSNGSSDVVVDDYANAWYLNIASPDRTYCAELGRKLEDGTFVFIARSNLTHTPRNTLSDRVDPDWMMVTGDYKKLYGRMGHDQGISSYSLFEHKQ